MNSYTINRGTDRIISISFREFVGGEWVDFSPSSISASLSVTLSGAYGGGKRTLPFRVVGETVEIEFRGADQKIGTYYVDVSFSRPSSGMNDGTESVSLRIGEITVVGIDDGSGNFTGSIALNEGDTVRLIAELRSQVANLSQRVSSLTSENNRVTQENTSLKGQVEAAKQTIASKDREISEKNRTISQKEEVISQKEQIISQKEQVISEKNAEIERLKRELSDALNSNDNERIKNLEAKLRQAEAERDSAISERDQLRVEKTDLEAQVSQLTEGLQEAEREKAEAIRAKEKAEADLTHVIENIRDGKTPQISIGDVTEGETNATLTPDGEDEQGNPRLKLNLTLARGRDGKMPTIGIGAVSTVDSAQSASVTIRNNGDDGYLLDISIPRGANGSDATIDVSAVTISFTEAEEEENISSGETLPTLFGKIKKILSALADKFAPKTHNHDDLYSKVGHNHNDLYSEKVHTHSTYALRTHTHSEYAQVMHTHDGVYASLNHAHDYASTGHNHDNAYLKKDYYEGVNSVATLSNLPITKKIIKATLSTSSNLTLDGTMSEGQSLHVIAKATAPFRLPIPNSSGWKTPKEMLDIKEGQLVEISIMYIHGVHIVLTNVL